MHLPKVSIIIPTYNRQRWLAKAVDSALNQSYPHLEVIIVSDGPLTEESIELKHQHPEVCWLEQLHKGAGAARNFGLAISQGDLIQFLDDDDWLTENSINEKLGCFQSDPSLDVVYSDVFITNENGKIQFRYFARYRRPLPTGDLYPALIHRNFLPIHALLWKKSTLSKIGGFPARSGNEDWEALIRVSEFGRFSFIDAPLGYYRQHPASMSRSFQTMFKGKIIFQQEIAHSARFQTLSNNQRKRLLLKFSLQQAAFGDLENVKDFFSTACSIPGNQSVEFITQVALKLNQRVLQWVFKLWSQIYRLL